MIYDYDLEFLEDGRTIMPISIGIVAEDGREYYAVNGSISTRRVEKHPWLMENVVPHLPQPHGDRLLTMPKGWLFDYAHPLVKTRRRIAAEVRDFLTAAPDVELWANYGAYDHVALCQLWGSMVDLPSGIPMFTRDIQQEAARLGVGWDELPKQQGGEHNALADARHNQTVRRWLAAQA